MLTGTVYLKSKTAFRGRAKSISGGGGGAHIHIFVLCIINLFWNRLFLQCEHEYMNMCPPSIIHLPRLLTAFILNWYFWGIFTFFKLILGFERVSSDDITSFMLVVEQRAADISFEQRNDGHCFYFEVWTNFTPKMWEGHIVCSAW